MREFKFRAWVVEQETHCEDGPRKPFMTRPFGFQSFDGEYFKPNHVSLYYSEFTIMQYTGLKDINGKEIYEGDILSLGDGNYEVKFGEHYTNCEYSGYWGFYIKPIANNNIFFTENIGTRRNDGIIIGNIYENPELLK